MLKIAVIPGDGIGPEVTREGVKIIESVAKKVGASIQLTHFDYGAERYLATGVSLPEEEKTNFSENYDAIFLGALGDPRVPDMKHAADILLGLRFGLDLYINQRPVKLLDEKLCPLKGVKTEDVDFVCFRENTEGLYVGMGGIFKKNTPDEIAIQEDVNTFKGVQRIIQFAFDYCKKHDRGRLVMSDKSNVLTYGHDLWQRVFEAEKANNPGIESWHLYVDALSMQMVKNPAQFDVIVTCNMFGDIVTDIGAQLQGGLGMAASGNINPEGTSLFEPVHGSAPKYTDKGVANPMGAILTAQMMLEHLNVADAGQLIEDAVKEAVKKDLTTVDLGGKLTTSEVGDAVRDLIQSR